MTTPDETAREIVLWLYGPDDGACTEGLLRTLKDKIAESLRQARLEAYEECAKIADAHQKKYGSADARTIAAAIRNAAKSDE